MKRIAEWIDAYARIGVDKVENSQKSSRYAFNLLCLVAGFASASYTAFYFGMGFWQLGVAAAPVISVGFLAPVTRRSEPLSILIGFTVCCFGFAALSYLAGRDTLLHLFIVLFVLNDAILRGIRRPRETAVLGSVAILIIALCHFNFATPALGSAITPRFSSGLATVNLIALGAMLLATLLALLQQIRFVQGLLDAEYARSEALLLNLLPEEIAARLKNRPGEVIADGLPAVTLLFADIADFTPRSARMAPEDLVTFLNRIFSAFDELTAERGLEKIKTIGDAYMVAAGLPQARDDHAEVVADMALAMQARAKEIARELGETLDLRIGIHSGPAIAGVIGTSKVFYDVWGDTVNTASRMESHGVPGRIQVTATTRAILRDKYVFAPRGMMEIKGVGQMETWWLKGRA